MTLQLLLTGAAIACMPVSVIAFLSLLSTDGGSRRALGFIVGWVLTLVALIVLTLLLTGGTPLRPGTGPSNLVLSAEILVGLVLLWLALRSRHAAGRPATGGVEPPAAVRKFEKLGFVGSMAVGVFMSHPPLVAAGALDITSADITRS